ncbi:mutator-like transposase, partial [Striga asiatica]
VYPEVNHCFCAYHLSRNIITNYKENLEVVKGAFFAAAYAYTNNEFTHHMDITEKANKKVEEYLNSIGVDKWSRVTVLGYDFKCRTTTKSAQDLPITLLLESVRGMQQDWNVKNRKEAQSTFTKLAKLGQKKLEGYYKASMKLTIRKVQQPSEDIFKVKNGTQIFIVNMKERTCSCNKFQMEELSCESVIKGKQEELEDYCFDFYFTSTLLATYSTAVFLVDYEMKNDAYEGKNEISIFPSKEITLTGRRKKKRFYPAGSAEARNHVKDVHDDGNI